LRLLGFVADEGQDFIATPASLGIVLVAPILNIVVTTVALCLRRPEGQAATPRLVSTVEIVDQRDDERLRSTTVGKRERGWNALKENICQELERCYVTFAYRNARYVNTNVALDPRMKLVIIAGSFELQPA
jgi:hypothetical protein